MQSRTLGWQDTVITYRTWQLTSSLTLVRCEQLQCELVLYVANKVEKEKPVKTELCLCVSLPEMPSWWQLSLLYHVVATITFDCRFDACMFAVCEMSSCLRHGHRCFNNVSPFFYNSHHHWLL